MSDLLLNDAAAPIASVSSATTGRATDGLETLIDQLSATLQRSEVEGASQFDPLQTRGLEALFVFGLAGARYAVPMSVVVEVQRMPASTRLPNVAVWATGVANLRGDIVSVIDARRFLNLPDSNVVAGQLKKLLVLRSREQDLQVGLAVDRVFGLRQINVEEIKAPTGDIHETVVSYLTGACEIDSQLVLVLNSEQLLKTLSAPFAALS